MENIMQTDSTCDDTKQPSVVNNDQNQYMCPISLELMKLPVSTNCGHTYDFNSITKWLHDNCSCPSCREEVTELTINRRLRLQMKLANLEVDETDILPEYTIAPKREASQESGDDAIPALLFTEAIFGRRRSNSIFQTHDEERGLSPGERLISGLLTTVAHRVAEERNADQIGGFVDDMISTAFGAFMLASELNDAVVAEYQPPTAINSTRQQNSHGATEDTPRPYRMG